MPSHGFSLRGKGVSALRKQLHNLCRAGNWPLLEPLPGTRFLGGSFGISNVSAFRVLNELSRSLAVCPPMWTARRVSWWITHEFAFDTAPDAYARLEVPPDEMIGTVLRYS